MLERKFGIKAFDYWWGYTTAQIELMVMDQPVVDYGHDKKKKGSMMASRAEVEEMERLSEEWSSRRNGKTFVGQTVNLSEFVGQKME